MFARLAKVGKLFQAGAGAIFNALTVSVFYLIAKDINENEESAFKNPLVLTASSVALFANIIVTSRTRLPAIDRKIRERKKQSSIECCSCCSEISPCDYCGINRNCTANYVSAVAKTSAVSSLFWVGENTVFFVLKVAELIQSLTDSKADTVPSKIGIGAAALLIAFANLVSSLSLNFKTTIENINSIVNSLRTGDWRFDRATNLSLLIVIMNSIPTLAFAFYSTAKSLEKVPYLKDDPRTIEILADLSTISAVLSGIFSTSGQIYKKITNDSSIRINRLSVFNLANLTESLFVAAANTVSIAHSLQRKYELDEHSLQALIPAGIFGALAGWVNYVFSNQAYVTTLCDESKMAAERLSRNHSSPALNRLIKPPRYRSPSLRPIHEAVHEEKISADDLKLSSHAVDIHRTTSSPNFSAVLVQDHQKTKKPNEKKLFDANKKTKPSSSHDDSLVTSCTPEKRYKTNWSPKQWKAKPDVVINMVSLTQPLLDSPSP